MDDACLSPEWTYMRTIIPQRYICFHTSQEIPLDGRLDKEIWRNVPWTEFFKDIQGTDRAQPPHFKTRAKMLWSDTFFYVGIEMEEPRIWGTLLVKNSTMYHENDIEIFIDPDGSHHNYYEFEANCLNTIWELVLNKPYKDGHSIKNPYNLAETRSAVYLEGIANDPTSPESKGWSIEVAIPLSELMQFDRKERKLQHGDIWKVNFSRVQWKTEVINNTYKKVPNLREDNWVWSPTGVIDMHRPEKWGIVYFDAAEVDAIPTLANFPSHFDQLLHIHDVLNTVYYDQREFSSKNGQIADSFQRLYPNDERKLASWNIEIVVDSQDHQTYTASVSFNILGEMRRFTINHEALVLEC